MTATTASESQKKTYREIQEVMAAYKIGMTELSDRSGVARMTLQYWFYGEKSSSEKKLRAVIEALIERTESIDSGQEEVNRQIESLRSLKSA